MCHAVFSEQGSLQQTENFPACTELTFYICSLSSLIIREKVNYNDDGCGCKSQTLLQNIRATPTQGPDFNGKHVLCTDLYDNPSRITLHVIYSSSLAQCLAQKRHLVPHLKETNVLVALVYVLKRKTVAN